MDRTYHFIYPVDKNGDRTGHSICVLIGNDPKTKAPRAYHGISLCSPEDQFEYKKGKELALDRALAAEAALHKKHGDHS